MNLAQYNKIVLDEYVIIRMIPIKRYQFLLTFCCIHGDFNIRWSTNDQLQLQLRLILFNGSFSCVTRYVLILNDIYRYYGTHKLTAYVHFFVF